MPAGASRAALGNRPTCRLSVFRRRSGCVPAEPYPPLKPPQLRATLSCEQQKPPPEHHFSSFDRTVPSSFDRTTTAFIAKDATLLEALPYIQRFRSQTFVVNTAAGGNGLASLASVEFL